MSGKERKKERKTPFPPLGLTSKGRESARKREKRGGKKRGLETKTPAHPVHVSRRLHVRVRHGLPLLDHRKVWPLVRHEHGAGRAAAARRRLAQDVGAQPRLHVLDARAVDARVLQVGERCRGVADDEGPAVDVDDGLLAEVVPEDLAAPSLPLSLGRRGPAAAAAAPGSPALALRLAPFAPLLLLARPCSCPGPGPGGLQRPPEPGRGGDRDAEDGQPRDSPEVGRALDERAQPAVLAPGEVVRLEERGAGEDVAAARGDDDVGRGERGVAGLAAGVAAAGGGGRGGWRRGRRRRCCRRRSRCCRRRRHRIERVRFRLSHASPRFAVRGACRRRVEVTVSRSRTSRKRAGRGRKSGRFFFFWRGASDALLSKITK